MEDLTIGVVGAGTMGNGIAQVFAAAGHRVLLFDLNETLLQTGLRTVQSSLERLLKKELITPAEMEQTLANITCITTLERLQNADLVVEAATEEIGIKEQIFRELDRICKPQAILASNTSSISLTRIARVTGRPERVIGMHFMNPVPVMELVEIIRALQTSDEVYQVIHEIASAIGKTPIEVNDSPGFVSNRILLPMINEAVYTYAEGVATVEAIDGVMKLGMNHPIGPLALADLIGLDTCLSIMEVLHEGLGESKYRPCPLLRRMVDAGYLGRKSGRGFYHYH